MHETNGANGASQSNIPIRTLQSLPFSPPEEKKGIEIVTEESKPGDLDLEKIDSKLWPEQYFGLPVSYLKEIANLQRQANLFVLTTMTNINVLIEQGREVDFDTDASLTAFCKQMTDVMGTETPIGRVVNKIAKGDHLIGGDGSLVQQLRDSLAKSAQMSDDVDGPLIGGFEDEHGNTVGKK